MTTITLKALLEVLLGMQGTFVLCNAHGSLEFKGQDLYLSSYQEWLTVYHSTPKNPESQSHLHLKWHTFQRAVVTHEAGRTPYLAFYGPAEAETKHRSSGISPAFTTGPMARPRSRKTLPSMRRS